MKILIHAPSSVYPYFDGTGLRIYNLIPFLAEKNELTLIQEHWPWENRSKPLSPVDEPNIWYKKYFKKVHNIQHTQGEPLRYGFIWQSKELYLLLDSIFNTDSFDVVYAQNETYPLYLYDRGYRFGKKLLGPPALVGPTDSAHLYHWRNLKTSGKMKSAVRECLKWMYYVAFQYKVLNNFRHFLMVTKEDGKSMQHFSPKSQIHIIPNGVDVDWYKPNGIIQKDPLRIIFLGTLGSETPNEKSVEWFLRRVWPNLLQIIPQTQFGIIGRGPSTKLKNLCQNIPNVSIEGYVDDTRPYLWNAGIFLLPMVSGSGIKNKLLEAWAAQCAIISTKYGLQGIDFAIPDKNYVYANTANDMLSKIKHLLEDHQQQKLLGLNGFQTADKYYRWSYMSEKLNLLLEDIRVSSII